MGNQLELLETVSLKMEMVPMSLTVNFLSIDVKERDLLGACRKGIRLRERAAGLVSGTGSIWVLETEIPGIGEDEVALLEGGECKMNSSCGWRCCFLKALKTAEMTHSLCYSLKQ